MGCASIRSGERGSGDVPTPASQEPRRHGEALPLSAIANNERAPTASGLCPGIALGASRDIPTAHRICRMRHLLAQGPGRRGSADCAAGLSAGAFRPDRNAEEQPTRESQSWTTEIQHHAIAITLIAVQEPARRPVKFFPLDLVVRFKPGALVLAHRVRDTAISNSLNGRCFVVSPYGPRHGVSRGTQRGTFARYTSYSAPNVPCSVGSSYATTNRWKASQNTAPNRTSPQAPNNKA